MFICPYCRKGVYDNQPVVWKGSQYVHQECYDKAHPLKEEEDKVIVARAVVFSIEKVSEEHENFAEQVIEALREYALRIKRTGGEVVDNFKTKSGCKVKMFHTLKSIEEEK